MENTRHYFEFQERELISVSGRGTYFVNRDRMRLENIEDSNDVLQLVEEYCPLSHMEGPEIYHRFCKLDPQSRDEIGDDVILDSSPNILDAIWERSFTAASTSRDPVAVEMTNRHIRSQYIQQLILFQGLEFVIVDELKTYFVNREHEQLENIFDPDDVLPLEQVSFGRRDNGDTEVLERYCREDDDESVCIDSSPSFLAELAA